MLVLMQGMIEEDQGFVSDAPLNMKQDTTRTENREQRTENRGENRGINRGIYPNL